MHGQLLAAQFEQLPHLHLALIEGRLLNAVPVQPLDGNGQLVCHRLGVYASFHPGPPLVSGRHHTPLCIGTEGRFYCFCFASRYIRTKLHPTERPGLVQALEFCRTGDTLVVWKLDRLGRSQSSSEG